MGKSISAIVSAYLIKLFVGLVLDGTKTLLPMLVVDWKQEVHSSILIDFSLQNW